MTYEQPISIAHIDGTHSVTTLSQLLSKSTYTVIYFYPKDCTSGCTIEAVEFSLIIDQFRQHHIQVLGVSKDNIASHHHFITDSQLQVDLISDEDTTLHQFFGARGQKSMYGRTYMGTIRSTFVLDQSGKIIRQYHNVKSRGHAQQVLNDMIE